MAAYEGLKMELEISDNSVCVSVCLCVWVGVCVWLGFLDLTV